MTVETVGGRRIVGVGGARRFLAEGEDAPSIQPIKEEETEVPSEQPAKEAAQPSRRTKPPAAPLAVEE